MTKAAKREFQKDNEFEGEDKSDYGEGECLVYYRCSLRNTILDVLSAREGWKETTSSIDWDLNWADTAWIRENFNTLKLDDAQKINHFKNHYELTRKDLLNKNLRR